MEKRRNSAALKIQRWFRQIRFKRRPTSPLSWDHSPQDPNSEANFNWTDELQDPGPEVFIRRYTDELVEEVVESINETFEAKDLLSDTSTAYLDLSSTSDEDVFLPAVPNLPAPPWRLNRSGAFRYKNRQPSPIRSNNNNLPPIPENADPRLQHIPHNPVVPEQPKDDENPPDPRPRRSNRLRKDNPNVKGDSWTN